VEEQILAHHAAEISREQAGLQPGANRTFTRNGSCRGPTGDGSGERAMGQKVWRRLTILGEAGERGGEEEEEEE
jgi:hypothetical protein